MFYMLVVGGGHTFYAYVILHHTYQELLLSYAFNTRIYRRQSEQVDAADSVYRYLQRAHTRLDRL